VLVASINRRLLATVRCAATELAQPANLSAERPPLLDPVGDGCCDPCLSEGALGRRAGRRFSTVRARSRRSIRSSRASEALAAERLAWERAFAPLTDLVSRLVHAGASGGEELAIWLERLHGSGAVKRAEPNPQAAQSLEHLAAVLEALPADGQPLAGFAARVAGGAHALDEGRPLAALALGAVRALARLAGPGPDESHTEARREAWASVGVLCDELSSVVLALGLPGEQQTASGRILWVARESGQPLRLTLRQLVRDMPNWASTSRQGLSGQTVYICENPAVVAVAADRLGSECAPLVCTNGQPGVATMLLLWALGASGARLVHHSDFDWCQGS
jgi:uncharacterized protein (TIGR02679 family)